MHRFVVPLFTALAVVAGSAVSAGAAEKAPFTPAALQAAEQAGKPIVIHVTASWCTTCAAQKPIVEEILKDPKFKDLVLLDLDFDKEKAELRKLNVQIQSTFVAFHGKDQVGRSSGETNPKSIKHLFEKTIY